VQERRELTLRRDLDAALPGATPHAAGREPAAADGREAYGLRSRAPPAGRGRGAEGRCGDGGARRHSEKRMETRAVNALSASLSISSTDTAKFSFTLFARGAYENF
jgi:hypothetical protein